MYLTAVVDVFSRRILAHRVSITLEARHAVETIHEALARHGTPDIVNTDQGCWRRFKIDQLCRLNFDQGSEPGFWILGCG